MRFALLAAVLFGTTLPASAQFSGMTCDDLWVARNQIYKDAGYCFRTPRAISYFGNAGCSADAMEDVPLSARQRGDVQAIQRQERRLSCPR